jgi:hypothetical protein
MGHATVAFALDTYAHALPAAHRDAMNIITELFNDRNQHLRMENRKPKQQRPRPENLWSGSL